MVGWDGKEALSESVCLGVLLLEQKTATHLQTVGE